MAHSLPKGLSKKQAVSYRRWLARGKNAAQARALASKSPSYQINTTKP